MDTPPKLEDRLPAAIEGLRELLREYQLLPEDQQKSVRHALYEKQGKFGKAVTTLVVPEFKKLEQEYVLKKVSQGA